MKKNTRTINQTPLTPCSDTCQLAIEIRKLTKLKGYSSTQPFNEELFQQRLKEIETLPESDKQFLFHIINSVLCNYEAGLLAEKYRNTPVTNTATSHNRM